MKIRSLLSVDCYWVSEMRISNLLMVFKNTRYERGDCKDYEKNPKIEI